MSLETGRRTRRTTEIVPKQLERQFSTNASSPDLGTISTRALAGLQLANIVIYRVTYILSVWLLL
jgi:hypothetical protein